MTVKMAAPMYFQSLLFCFIFVNINAFSLPVVVNTWPFTNATLAAWNKITTPNKTAVDAVEAGCSECEVQRCDGTVGWGGDPDEMGETTLDAMIMDGITHDVGSVGAIRRVKTAISVARAVMERTTHTLLAGDQATEFAAQLGFQIEDLHSNKSRDIYQQWKQNNCQPNYWKNVVPDPKKFCGPYKPTPFPPMRREQQLSEDRYKNIGGDNHDTIGMIVIDSHGNVAGGTSTNGLNHKVPGRVGDSPIVGAGSYVDNDVGGAASTGDGDVMMRFLPSFHAVMLMKAGVSPAVATGEAIKNILRFYPDFVGAVLAINIHGEHGAACTGIPKFPYSIRSADYSDVTVLEVPCIS